MRLVPWLIGIAFAAYMIRQSIAVNRKLMKLFLITLRSTRPTEVAELTRGNRRSLKQMLYVAMFQERAFRDRYVNAMASKVRLMWLISMAAPSIVFYIAVGRLSELSIFK